MPDGKYMDSNLFRWELVCKEGWELPPERGEDEDQLDLSTTNVAIVVAVVAVVVASSYLLRRKK